MSGKFVSGFALLALAVLASGEADAIALSAGAESQEPGAGGSVADRDPDAQKEKCAIIPATGDKVEPETDFVVAGEMGLLLSRTYNHYGEARAFSADGTLSVIETNPLGYQTTVLYKDGNPATTRSRA